MKATMIFNHYKNILDELLDESNFFKYYFQNPSTLDEDICWEDYEECEALYTNSTNLRFGATRGCLIDDEYDWVVKFDLDEAEEHGSCGEEVTFYEHAAQNGLERYFSRPIYLGKYVKKIKFYEYCEIWEVVEEARYFDEDHFCNMLQNGIENWDLEKKEITITIPLYAYPRAERYDFYVYEEDQDETYRSISRSNSPLVERETGIGYAFVSRYGEEEFFRLSEFLEEMEINDLHTGNVMEVNGELVITDYSGYRDY